MARIPSAMVALGTKAPHFSLPDTVSGRTVTLTEFTDVPALVVMFICNHCPFVKHLNAGLVSLVREYQTRGVHFVGISSNNVETHPEDSPDKMRLVAIAEGYTFPYLYDESQAVAHAYQAACTPDFFIYGRNSALVYRGQFDSSRPGNEVPVTGEDMRRALDCILEGRPVPEEQRPSIGCNIKWK